MIEFEWDMRITVKRLLQSRQIDLWHYAQHRKSSREESTHVRWVKLSKGRSYPVLVMFFIIGLIIGIGLTYTLFPSTSTSTSTVYSSSTTTELLVPSCPSTYSPSGYCEVGGNPSLALIERAFNYSSTLKLELWSYTFEPVKLPTIPNGTLQACFVNTGSEPAMISTANVLINNTSLQSTAVVSSYTYDASSTNHYAFVAANETTPSLSTLTIYLIVPNALVGHNYTLSIYGNSWTLKYGTALSNSSSTSPC